MVFAPTDTPPNNPSDTALWRVDLADDPTDWLVAAPRRVVSARRSPEFGPLQIGWRPADDGLAFRTLDISDWDTLVAPLAHAVTFLPKRSWKTDHIPMLHNGLVCGRWLGTGLVDGDGRLVSYLDHCWREDGYAEIGFCMTHPDHRGRGLMTRLLTHLMLRCFAFDFQVSTHQHNAAMIAALAHFGFHVKEARLGERINGEASLYMRRAADQPFDLGSGDPGQRRPPTAPPIG